tara:strand:- start:488 stop:649 length:162 start_codon:yes stop_codon:yes gene_type:complete
MVEGKRTGIKGFNGIFEKTTKTEKLTLDPMETGSRNLIQEKSKPTKNGKGYGI